MKTYQQLRAQQCGSQPLVGAVRQATRSLAASRTTQAGALWLRSEQQQLGRAARLPSEWRGAFIVASAAQPGPTSQPARSLVASASTQVAPVTSRTLYSSVLAGACVARPLTAAGGR